MNQQANHAELDEASFMPTPGEVIADKYRIDSIVGSGGMGVVLSATHLALGQHVAIKVLTVPDDDSRREEARERFLREGRATAALVSDHVVRIHDVGTLPSGAPFMVMELLRGQDLARALQQTGPLGVELACDCVRQAAEAIHCAHTQGIVHRDLKPSNLFLTQRSDGSPLVKVLDFGISKTTGTELEPLTGNLTETRSVLGTPFYMSPEQVRDAKKVDARTDIWSLGLILHELLAASPAFEGTTLPGVCAAIAADPPAALRLKRPEVPVEVEAIVLKCLEKDPNRRFQSARELSDALLTWAAPADSKLLSPLSDQTIRSSSLPFELRPGSTVSRGASLASDSGTLASAVFTESGERVVGLSVAAQSTAPAVDSPPAPEPASPHNSSGLGKRASFAIGASALLGLAAIIVWALASSGAAPRAAAAAAAAPTIPSAVFPGSPVTPPTPVTTAAPFSVLVESNPPHAQVFEGGSLLGTTPLRLTVDPAHGPPLPRTFSLTLAGYLPYTLVQNALDHDSSVMAELRRGPSELGSAAIPRAAARGPAPALPHKKPLPAPSAAAAQPDIFMQR